MIINMVFEVESLSKLAAKRSVREANLLRVHAGIIPPILYEQLMLASINTNRVLSIRSLMLSWPLQEMSLANCKAFTPEHASMIAHCLQDGWNKLRLINLSGCNTGIQGTTLLLKLATGRILPNAHTYGTSSGQNRAASKIENGIASSVRLHLQADCYIDQENFPLFIQVLKNQTLLDLNVSCLHAMELGFKQIQILLKMATKFTLAKLIKGLHFEMNGLPALNLKHFENTKRINERLVPVSFYHFDSFDSFSSLEYLNLSGNIVGSLVIFMILLNLPEKVKLTHLLLNSCNLGPVHYYIVEIADLKCIEKLENLELGDNRIKYISADFLTLFLKCSSTLVHLNLEMNGLKRDSVNVQMIKELLKPPFTLKELNIGNNPISSFKDLLDFNTSCSHIKC